MSATVTATGTPEDRPPTQVERESSQVNLLDVLDRVLDKGVVIDAWVRVSVAGIDLVTVEARVVVASIETYLHHSAALADARPAARPNCETERRTLSLAEALSMPGPLPAPLGGASPAEPLSPGVAAPPAKATSG